MEVTLYCARKKRLFFLGILLFIVMLISGIYALNKEIITTESGISTGAVDIKIEEYNGNTQPFDEDGSYVMPGDEIVLIPRVNNLGVDCYLRAKIEYVIDGNEFPVTVTDDQTGKEFSTVIDLSKINYKEFTLKGDENGWFEFVTPTTKDKIKFAFLTFGENVEIMDKDKEEDVSIKKEELLDMAKRIEKYKNDSLSKTYNKNAWGMTACETPSGYMGSQGALPSANNNTHTADGTVPPCGPAGSPDPRYREGTDSGCS